MVTERKMVELKQRAEAVATQRQEVMIPLKQHRRFSETVAIDHRARPQELQVCLRRFFTRALYDQKQESGHRGRHWDFI
jgi:hypothetical protein